MGRTPVQLVGTVPGVGEHHGCPFKTFDEANLRAALSRMKVSSRYCVHLWAVALPPALVATSAFLLVALLVPRPPLALLVLPLSLVTSTCFSAPSRLSPPSSSLPSPETRRFLCPFPPCHLTFPGSPPPPPSFADDAVRKAKGGHYQLACGAAFEGSHGCACDEGIQHPNQALLPAAPPVSSLVPIRLSYSHVAIRLPQYYDESRKLEEPQESLPPTTPAIGATNPMELTTPATDNSYASNKRPVPDSTPTKDMATPSAMPPPKRKISGTPTLAFPTPAKVG